MGKERGGHSQILCTPHQFAVDITNKCNLRCLHCYNSSGENRIVDSEMSGEELRALAKAIAGLGPLGCCVCGGEPLVRSEETIGFIEGLSKSGCRINMVSNGILLNSEILHRLTNAGLTGIQFSLDGLEISHDRLRNRKGSFSRALHAAEMVLSETDLTLSIAFCPTSFNVNDFEPLVRLLIDLYKGSGREERLGRSDEISFRMQPLMLLGRARANREMRPSAEQYRRLVATKQRLEQTLFEEHIHFDWGDPVDHLIRYRERALPVDQVMIRANGDIIVSPYIPLVGGNVRRHELLEYWNAGLDRIWSSPLVRYLAEKLYSIGTMELMSEEVGDVNMGGDYEVDLVDDDVFDEDDSLLMRLKKEGNLEA